MSKSDIKEMLKKHNFFDSSKNKSGHFKNDFVIKGDGTVTDRATGLMWQKGGSEKYLVYSKTDDYILSLNRDRFADYNDWRLPTVEELASLIENRKMNGGLNIDPVFNKRQEWCWSADKRKSVSAWYVSFYHGSVYCSGFSSYYVRAVRSWQ